MISLKTKLLAQRCSDIATLVVWAPALIPLTSLVLAVSLADCKIPPIYKQKRVGHMGKEFNIVKARTMQDLDKLDPTGALKIRYEGMSAEAKAEFDDKYRISRIGRFLRKSRLDELPQIWNIARGEMSIVGPRPHKVGYKINIQYPDRQKVRPGLTGEGKVAGLNSISHLAEGLIDNQYVEKVMNDSILSLHWHRVKICVKTPLAIIKHRKAPDAYMHKTI